MPGFDFLYLSAPLGRYEYVKNLLALFLDWIKTQYNLDSLALDGFVFLKMRHAVWGISPGRYLGKQVTMQKTSLTRILQMCKYPRPLETFHTPDCVHSGC